MHVFANVDEVEAAQGKHLGHSEWVEITQERVNQFADATGDHQWIHVDVERAKSGPFGGTIAHGYLTLSLLPLLVHQVYQVQSVAMAVNYGTEKVRFPSPVRVGSRVRAGVEVGSFERTKAGVRVTTKVTVEIDGQDKPACVAESVTLFVPNP